jgi:hypothetical protein
MVLVFAIAIGIVVGLALGGSLGRLADLELRGRPLFGVAIAANGGHMPALPSALRGAGVPFDGVYQNSVAAGHPNVAWLVDRWAAPEWVLGANVYSVGDVLLGVGGIVIVVAAMGPRLLRRQAPVRAEPAD